MSAAYQKRKREFRSNPAYKKMAREKCEADLKILRLIEERDVARTELKEIKRKLKELL